MFVTNKDPRWKQLLAKLLRKPVWKELGYVDVD